MKRTILTFVLTFAAALSAAAQTPDFAADRQRTEMKKFEKMAGVWEGDGWIQMGPKKEQFRGTETVQWKIDGLALLVEGKFKAKVDDKVLDKVIHETLAVISYNTKTSIFDFKTFLASGSQGAHEIKSTGETVFVWGFTSPNGNIRYTITTANDVWNEIGEMSRDGKTWMKFFEMKLQKRK